VARSNTDTFDVIRSLPDAVRQTDRATTGRIGAIYEFESGVAPYATYATSFTPNVGITSLLDPLKPTTGTLYEAGVKYQPRGSKILIQASVFDLTQQNVLSIDPVDPTFRNQIGEVHSKGFEIEGKASVTNRLDIMGAFSYTDATVTRSIDTDLGKRPTWIPQYIASLWADYTFRDGPLNGFGAALGVRYMGQTWGDKENSILDVPQYTLIDAALHYELENLDPRLKGAKLSINATNLFDRIYVSQCTVQQFDNACVYGLRRQVLASLRYRW
jgi:iron complex outermembrane recepter protein